MWEGMSDTALAENENIDDNLSVLLAGSEHLNHHTTYLQVGYCEKATWWAYFAFR